MFERKFNLQQQIDLEARARAVPTPQNTTKHHETPRNTTKQTSTTNTETTHATTKQKKTTHI